MARPSEVVTYTGRDYLLHLKEAWQPGEHWALIGPTGDGKTNHALQLAPTASLYVNDFNVPARRLYERLGMHHSATLATVLF